MTGQPAGEKALIGRSYTRARKHPLVVGKLPGGGRLPGGPYTITQIVTMVGVFVLLLGLRDLWAVFGLGNALVMIIVPWGLAWLMRYARMDGRDPARALLGLITYGTTPPGGRLAGRPQRTFKAKLVTGRVTIRLRPAAPDPSPAPEARPVRLVTTTARTGGQQPDSAPAEQAPARPRTRLQELLDEAERQ
ncbi:conjugal transfer protein [Streptomyces sp. NBC_00876]|uniref:TcpE family conjugal transfer membrane protein n=1 Tax=Streptomyces sp. NBC_00876 TaxID=2975853 RepID=UPI00386A9C0C|nr:conjugal transfer protein [Streptomyces sp. NBC_00876]